MRREGPVERLDRVALGEGDVGRGLAGAGRPRRRSARAEPPARPCRRNVGATPSASSSRRPSARRPDRRSRGRRPCVPVDRGRDASAPSRIAARTRACAGSRIRRRRRPAARARAAPSVAASTAETIVRALAAWSIGEAPPSPRRRRHRRADPTTRGRAPPAAAAARPAAARPPPSRATAPRRRPATRPSRARRSARPRTSRAAAPGRTGRPRPPSARATPRASRPGPRDAPRPARRGSTSAARPGTRRSRRHRSPASGRPRSRCATASTSRAASPIAVVVTRRCASGSQACESAPCCDTMRSGPNAAASSGSSTADRRQPRPLAGPRLQRHVDRRPGRRPLPQLPHPAGPREQVPPGLVERQRQDARVGPVDRLDPVAVVDVEVHVQDAQPVAPRPGDGQRRVVVDAEPRGPVGHRVMEAAARVEGVLDVAAQDRLDAPGASRRRPSPPASCIPANGGSSPPSPMPGLREARTDRPRTA